MTAGKEQITRKNIVEHHLSEISIMPKKLKHAVVGDGFKEHT